MSAELVFTTESAVPSGRRRSARAARGARPRAHRRRCDRGRGAAQLDRPRAARRGVRVRAVLARRAPPEPGRRGLRPAHPARHHRRRDRADPRRHGRDDPRQLRAAAGGRGVRHGRVALARPRRPRARPVGVPAAGRRRRGDRAERRRGIRFARGIRHHCRTASSTTSSCHRRARSTSTGRASRCRAGSSDASPATPPASPTRSTTCSRSSAAATWATASPSPCSRPRAAACRSGSTARPPARAPASPAAWACGTAPTTTSHPAA